MLRRDVVDLASRSLAGALVEPKNAFPRKIQAIKAELAAKGIAGGPAASIVSDAARKECESRIDIATDELRRAANSKGVRYYGTLGKDLSDALTEMISQGLCADVQALSVTAFHVVPNARSGLGMFHSALQSAEHSRLFKSRTDLEHYAESLHTVERERAREFRLKLWQRLVAATIGAAIGAALTLLLQSISHRFGIG